MTPLAFKIAKNLTLPVKQRMFLDDDRHLRALSGVHCFECSSVLAAATEMYRSELDKGRDFSKTVEATGFLPAEKTWLEYHDDEYPVAYFLIDRGDSAYVKIYIGDPHSEKTMTFPGNMIIPLMTANVSEFDVFVSDDMRENMDEHGPAIHMLRIYSFLAMINTPRIIGRRQHMPHRGLERKLAAQRAVIGKFPLHAWTEIKLEITAPRDASSESSVEAHYTGEKALHFCRSHIRIRLGKLEIVRGHWRGDASLGIKQSRYKLTAGSHRAAPSGDEAAA